jgi:putative nucleotidyltransferase with HDIG domain
MQPIAETPWALRQVPPFPPVAAKLTRLTADPYVAIRSIVKLLRADVGFGTEILRRANSAFYGCSGSVNTLEQAVLRIGFDEVRSLAMAASVGVYLRSALKLKSLRRCWLHSLACAMIAEEFGRGNRVGGDLAYTAGLLHDIGLLGLMVNYPVEYDNLLNSAQCGFDLRAAERRLFEIDHCEAGGWLARQWKFPEPIALIAEGHHEENPGGDPSLGTLVHWSCRLATASGLGIVAAGSPPAEDLFELAPEFMRGRRPADIEDWRRKLAEKIELFG